MTTLNSKQNNNNSNKTT